VLKEHQMLTPGHNIAPFDDVLDRLPAVRA
jgi:hypothetical protein